jgi:hypothetical protein
MVEEYIRARKDKQILVDASNKYIERGVLSTLKKPVNKQIRRNVIDKTYDQLLIYKVDCI